MKVIIIYSGKGGVGKTTTTANVARTLAAQGKKVFILDADVNTPSMPVIFPDKHPEQYIMVASLGYSTNHNIYVTDSAIRSYIGSCIEQINKLKPDYVLIDTPPSITDVHINLLEKINASGLIIVTQPNALSVTDINRTALFFQDRNVNIIGVVENMVIKPEQSKYSWPVLASIPLAADFNVNSVFDNNKDAYKAIATSIENLDSVVLANKRRQLFDESITVEDVMNMPFSKLGNIKFINLATWDAVREVLEDAELTPDMALMMLDTKTIGRMLAPFEKDDIAYFMITKAPCTEISLITGEIGEASLFVAESYYGIPRIKYKTSQGEVVLFPYEVMPVTHEELLAWQNEGYRITKDGRYLPNKETVQEVYNCFGSRVGLQEDWEASYDSIMSGNLQPVNDEPTIRPASESRPVGRRKKVKEMQTIGSFKNRNR